jgi:MFS family permease
MSEQASTINTDLSIARRVSRPHARFAIAILLAINLLNFFDRTLPGALAEPIRHEFGLSDTALGWVGTVFILFYAAIGLPIGRLADRWRRNRLLALGVGLWSLLTAATGVAWSATSLYVSRIGVGLGEAACAPTGQSLIGDLFPREQRARALAVFMLGLPLGIWLAFYFGGVVGSAYGWRRAFLLAAVPGLVLSALALFVRDPPRGASEVHVPTTGQAPSVSGAAFIRVLSNPVMLWIVASGALHNFNMYAINAFQTPLLQRYHGMNLHAANIVSATTLGAVGVIGMLAGGWLGDRVGTRRAGGRLLVAAVAMLLAVPCVTAALSLAPGSVGAYTLLMGVGFGLAFAYYATVYAAIQDVIVPELRATAVAVYFFAMYIAGAAMGPVLTGVLSDRLTRRAILEAHASGSIEPFKAIGLHQAMYIIPVFMAGAALVLFAAAWTARSQSVASTGTTQANAAP